jgi:hypothetical protein
VLDDVVRSLGLPGVELSIEPSRRGGLAGVRFEVLVGGRPVDGGAVLSVPVSARAPAGNAYGIMDISFSVTDVDDPSVSMIEDSRFLGPTP